MSMEEIQRQIGEAAAAKHLHDVEEANLKVVTAIYSSAKAYTNIILLGGYGAFFALWAFVRADAPKTAMLWTALLMIGSGAVFVLHEVRSMIFTARMIRQRLLATDGPGDPLAKLRAVEEAHLEATRKFGKVWIYFLLGTIVPALIALVILVTNIVIALFEQHAGT